jgi:hypothetical protein
MSGKKRPRVISVPLFSLLALPTPFVGSWIGRLVGLLLAQFHVLATVLAIGAGGAVSIWCWRRRNDARTSDRSGL